MLLSCLADFVSQPWCEEGSVIAVSSTGKFLLRLTTTFTFVCSLCELHWEVFRDWSHPVGNTKGHSVFLFIISFVTQKILMKKNLCSSKLTSSHSLENLYFGFLSQETIHCCANGVDVATRALWLHWGVSNRSRWAPETWMVVFMQKSWGWRERTKEE